MKGKLFVIPIALNLIACKKEFECTCTTSVNYYSKPVNPKSYTIQKRNSEQAMESCVDNYVNRDRMVINGFTCNITP